MVVDGWMWLWMMLLLLPGFTLVESNSGHWPLSFLQKNVSLLLREKVYDAHCMELNVKWKSDVITEQRK